MFVKRKLRVFFLISLWPMTLLAVNLASETLGGIKPGDEWSKVKSKYGEPDSSKSNGFVEELECHSWTYSYNAKGLEVTVCHADKNKTGPANVTIITASEKSEAKTGKGIGLGAGKNEIEKAYGKSEGDDNNQITYFDFESGVQVGFNLVSGKVSEITLIVAP